MSLRNNTDRTEDAAKAVATYSSATKSTAEDSFAQVSGLLCSLIHYCNSNEIDWDEALVQACFHAEAEIQEEAEATK